jgi:hypothetical protein
MAITPQYFSNDWHDDYVLGVLHSRIYKVWSLYLGTPLEQHPRSIPADAFETFPFPFPLGQEPQEDRRVAYIVLFARLLDERCHAWLNPHNASPEEIKQRTITNLYAEHPSWIDEINHYLDAAVYDAYGWSHDLSDEQIVERLLKLKSEKAV